MVLWKKKRQQEVIPIGRVFLQAPPSVNYEIEYEDNKMWNLGVQVVLEPHDWYRFQSESFYPELKKWLSGLGNPEIQGILDDLERQLSSEETKEKDTQD